MTDAQRAIVGFFKNSLNIDVGSVDEDLLADGRLDSLGVVELLFFLENHFDLRVDMEQLQLEQMRTVEAISRLVHAGGRGAARST
jgi:acyl carrier protein